MNPHLPGVPVRAPFDLQRPMQSERFGQLLVPFRRIALSILLGGVSACGGDAATDGPPSSAPADGTFARIQRDILDRSCVSCHRAGDANARQSQLVLTSDSAYLQLVGVGSVQQIARADGVTRVKPFRADSSLLYHKLSWIPGHHSRDYGQLMPMGTTKGVTAGQLHHPLQAT